MTIRELRWLAALRRNMNITRTAEELYITQSALSQCVKRAEDELGFTLFERSRRQIVLTKHGETFLDMAEQIIGEYDACLCGISAESSAPLTEIVIGVTPYINIYAARYIGRIVQAFPQLSVRLREDSSGNLAALFQHGEVHILSTNQPFDDAEHHVSVLGDFRISILLRRGSPLADACRDCGGAFPELDPKLLAKEPIAISAPGSYSRKMALDVFQQAGIEPHIIQTVSRPIALCALAESGIASAMYPVSTEIRRALGSHTTVCAIPKQYTAAYGRRYLVCSKSSLRKFPAGFYPMLENVFSDCLAAAMDNI